MNNLIVGYHSSTGPIRDSNQDTVGIPPLYRVSPAQWDQLGHLLAVADGAGVHRSGDVASQTAMAALFETFYRLPQPRGLAPRLYTAVHQANRAVLTAQANPAYRGMRTTLVAAAFHQGQLVIANVGDSRAYLVRGRRIQQITRDQARPHGVLANSLGHTPQLPIDIFTVPFQTGDRLLLCSDGLSNLVTAGELTAYVRQYQPQIAANGLIALANQRRSPDNVSVLIADLTAPPSLSPRPQTQRFGLSFLGLIIGLVLILFLVTNFILLAQPTVTPSPTATVECSCSPPNE